MPRFLTINANPSSTPEASKAPERLIAGDPSYI